MTAEPGAGRPALTDPGEIMHAAAFHHLSPALDAGGGPALSSAATDPVRRCGWAPFFRALGERGLAVAWSEGGEARLVPRPQASPSSGGLTRAIEHSRRFWQALFPARRV